MFQCILNDSLPIGFDMSKLALIGTTPKYLNNFIIKRITRILNMVVNNLNKHKIGSN